jgi:hypothetical protein
MGFAQLWSLSYCIWMRSPDRHRPQADRAGLHAGLDSARLNQGPQRLVDGGIVLKIGPHVWVEHNCAIGQVEMLGFAGPVWFVDGDGVSLAIGLIVFAANAAAEVVFRHQIVIGVIGIAVHKFSALWG